MGAINQCGGMRGLDIRFIHGYVAAIAQYGAWKGGVRCMVADSDLVVDGAVLGLGAWSTHYNYTLYSN